MSLLNRLANSENSYQGSAPRVLCVCSAGLLRSPTAAFLLSQPPYNFNTRSCGESADFALIVLDDVLVHWADAFVVMNEEQADYVTRSKMYRPSKPVFNLQAPDEYPRMDADLVSFMTKEFARLMPDGKLPKAV